jgi:hypothetical protein
MRLTERLEAVFSGTEVDSEKGVVRGVSLLGLESKNGYRYSEAAVKKAVGEGHYNNAQIFADHAPDGQVAPRGMAELVGVTMDARYDEASKRVKADVRVLKSSEMGRVFMEAATDPILSRSIGMSHDCDGHMDEQSKTVTEIARVHSVDLVTRPATTGGIHEHTKESKDMDEKEAKELREQLDAAKKAADAALKLAEEAKAAREKADKDAATLREQVAIKETAALVESESEDLPEKVRAKLRRQFEGKAAKAEDVKQAVQDMREICESVGGKDEHGRAIIGNGPRITEPAGSRADDLKELRETFHGHFFGCKRDSYAPSAK